MWPKRSDISASLRSLRRRVLDEGDAFFRVIAPGFTPRDFGRINGDYDESRSDARTAAEEYALDLASLCVGSSVFISERRELDGVQCLVGTKEISFDFLGGLQL